MQLCSIGTTKNYPGTKIRRDGAPLHQGQLGPMVGFPSIWLEIYPVRMEFQPLDGNPSSGWKFHQGLVGFPTICPKIDGRNSNHSSVNGRQGFIISFQLFLSGVFKTMKVKVDYNSLEFGDFLQLRWGTLLSSIVRR